MKKVLATSVAVALSCSTQASTIEEIGDITQLLTPIVGLGLTYYYDDTEGRWQFVKSFAASQVITHLAKSAADKRRPNFSDGSIGGSSYPSGHTSASFAGASFIYNRYGAAWGVPAYGLAAFTGYSRIYADKHYWDDVIAGASIATLSSLYFVNAVDENVAFLPKTDGDSIGINVVFSSDFFDSKAPTKKPSGEPFDGKYKFEFFSAFTQFETADPGHPVYGVNITDSDDNIATSVVKWSMQADKKNSFSFLWNPFEIRAAGDYQDDRAYARYMSNDFKLGWQRSFNVADNVITEVGAALITQFNEAEIYINPGDRETIAHNNEWVFYPAVTATLGYKFNQKVSFKVDGTYADNGDGQITDMVAELAYQFDERWDIGAGYSNYDRNNDNSESCKNIQFDSYFIKMGYRF